jgi:hypothetical protein
MNLIYRSASDGSEWSISHDESGHEWTAHLKDTDQRVRGGSRLEALDAIEDWLEERRPLRWAPPAAKESARAAAGWAWPFLTTGRGVRGLVPRDVPMPPWKRPREEDRGSSSRAVGLG